MRLWIFSWTSAWDRELEAFIAVCAVVRAGGERGLHGVGVPDAVDCGQRRSDREHAERQQYHKVVDTGELHCRRLDGLAALC